MAQVSPSSIHLPSVVGALSFLHGEFPWGPRVLLGGTLGWRTTSGKVFPASMSRAWTSRFCWCGGNGIIDDCRQCRREELSLRADTSGEEGAVFYGDSPGDEELSSIADGSRCARDCPSDKVDASL